jgi:hypothetical protein
MTGLLGGCHAAVVSATIRNESGAPIKMIELDYPSASFGVNAIAPGAEFHYEFEVHGSKALHLSYSDAADATHAADGPVLNQGDKGELRITVRPGAKVDWQR